MVTTLIHATSALAAGAIVGAADQYLVLAITGFAINAGWIQPAGVAANFGQPWFIGVAVAAFVLRSLPSWTHQSALATIVNAVNGPVSMLSAGLLALAGAGLIGSVSPEFAASMRLLGGRDPGWAQFDHWTTTDAVVTGGAAALGGGLTFVKFAAKPGVSLHTTTFGLAAAPMWVAAETVAAAGLTPVYLWTAQNAPWLAIVLAGVLVALGVALLVLSIGWLRQAWSGGGHVWALLREQPRAGIAVVLEFLVLGAGWLVAGQWARGLVLLALWTIILLLALSGIGLLLAVPLHCAVAIRSSRALFRELTEASRGVGSLHDPHAPPAHAG